MRIASAICSACLIVVLSQLVLQLLEEKYELQLVKYHQIIISKSALIVTGVSVVVSTIVQLLRWDNFSITEIVLIVLLLIGMSVLVVTDYKKQLVPNVLIRTMIAFWVVIVFVTFILDVNEGIQIVLQGILGAAICGIVFLLCYFLSKKQLGAGDVKLAFILGLYMGAPIALNTFLFGTVLCCVYSLIQVLRKKLGWKDSVPMVPFFMIGLWIVLLIA